VVDRSVGLVTYPKEPVEFSLTGSQKTVTAHWKELDDACGIKEYQVQLRQKNSSGAYDSLEEKKEVCFPNHLLQIYPVAICIR